MTEIRYLKITLVDGTRGTTAGAKVIADETWIAGRFGWVGARQNQALSALAEKEHGR